MSIKIDISPDAATNVVETVHTEGYVLLYLDGQEWRTKGSGSVKALAPLVAPLLGKIPFGPFARK